MKLIYEFIQLNEALLHLIRSKNSTFGEVSNEAGIHPSYFSRVMKSKGSFSQNQIYSICAALQLSDDETDYLFLLWSHNEAQSKSERLYFSKKIQQVREEKLKISQKLKAPVVSPEINTLRLENYYGEAITALVHMYLTLPEFQRDPKKITAMTRMSETKLNQELDKLHALGLIELKNTKVIKVRDSIHLDENSKLSFKNHINWRLKCIQNLEMHETQKDDYHLSVVFTADENTKHVLKQILRKTVMEIKETVDQCKEPTDVYQIAMDLYS